MTVLTKPPGRVSFELGSAQTAQYPQPQKMGWWDSMFGPSPAATNPYAQPRPLPPTQPAPQTPVSILAPAPAPAPALPPAPSSAAPPPAPPGTPGLPSSTGTGTGSGLHLPPPPPVLTPFPNTFASLPRHERKLWESMRKEELRAWNEWERGCKAAMKADEERKRREGKEKAKREKVLEKQKQQEAKLAAKLGYRPLPQLSKPAQSAPAPAPGTASASAPTAAANPAFGSGPPPQWNPTTWAHLPPLEEFGVRRPFDAPGRPPVDIGGVEWPKMSRTMTHALTEMSMEERIHMAQAGHTWSPATGWYRD